MRKKLLPTDVDPAEKWLAYLLLGELVNSIRPEDQTFEIKTRLFDLVYKLLEKTNQNRPPFIPELLFEAFEKINFQKEEITLSGKKYGMLVPIKGGFIIRIDSSEHSFRKRLAIAHEIGHSFFYDWESEIPTLRFSDSRYWVQEGYALEIARTILLPRDSIEEIVSSDKLYPSISSLKKLSTLYEVSYDVLRRRLINDLHIWNCIIFLSNIEKETIKTKGVNISKGKSYKILTIPKNISENRNNCQTLSALILSAYNNGYCEDTIRIKKTKYNVQCMRINDRKRNMVITLIK